MRAEAGALPRVAHEAAELRQASAQHPLRAMGAGCGVCLEDVVQGAARPRAGCAAHRVVPEKPLHPARLALAVGEVGMRRLGRVVGMRGVVGVRGQVGMRRVVRLAAVLGEGAEFTAVITRGYPVLRLGMASTVYLGATICCGTDIATESYTRIE